MESNSSSGYINIQGWRTFIRDLSIIIGTTIVAIMTKNPALVGSCGAVYCAIAGVNIWGKAKAGEQVLQASKQEDEKEIKIAAIIENK